MQLVFPDRPPSLVVEIQPTRALPCDDWRARLVPTAIVVRKHTTAGWPVELVQTQQTVYAFYELFDRGVLVTVRGDVAIAERWLLAADIERTTTELVALAQLWEAT